LFVAVMAVGCGLLGAQDKPQPPKQARPIDSLAWVVGGVWTADATAFGSGMRKIETRYAWSDNSAYVRFNTHFVLDKGTFKNYDGQFFWNPESKTLEMWYMDARNSITAGPVKIADDTTEMTFHGTDFEDKPADLRVRVIHKTADDYTWQLEEETPTGWKQLAKLEYLRTN